jgi:tRNA(Arg) A34 adenosine deaminase TadA
MVCIHKVASQDMSDNPSTRGNYLCTGYHLYITREPCIMYSLYLTPRVRIMSVEVS